MKRTIIIPISALFLMPFMTSCNNLSLEQKLKRLDGVSNVNKIEIEEYEGAKVCKEAYTFTIKQPIDWNNKELGTFEQKVNVYYNSDSSITDYNLSGYAIFNDSPLAQLKNSELHQRYNTNKVAIEYRFFANSKPEGFSYTDTKYASYLNSYQASKDFHHIITQLKTILKGKTIFEGASKGGYTTEMMCYYYPDDIDSYISYVAPLCNGDKDPNLHKYVHTNIGDASYGKEQAQKYRDIVKEFQRNALKEEKNFRYEIIKKLGIEKKGTLEDYEIYESSVGEFATGLWQYKGPADFDEIEKINKMPEITQDEINAKVAEMVKRLGSSETGGVNPDYINPYYIQAKTEMGNYAFSFDYLKKEGLEIKTADDRYSYVNDHTIYTDKQLEELKYTPTYRNALIDFYNTTKKDLVKIVGYNDPWYGVKAPVTTNEHIHLYEAKGNHSSGIKTLEEDKKNEAFGIVDKLVGYTK